MAARRQVLVWSWSLQTGPFVGDDAQALLSDDERARQRSFVSPELRRRFGAARAGLRTLLGRHLDLDPRRLAWPATARSISTSATARNGPFSPSATRRRLASISNAKGRSSISTWQSATSIPMR
jgi:phosphopantetheinyl transferase